MRVSRRSVLGAIPFLPSVARAQVLGSGSLAFDDLVRQIGGMAEIAPILLRAAEYEFAAKYGAPARHALVRALGTGPLEDRVAAAGADIQAQVAFLAALLYTGEVTHDGVTKASYYPWCLAWNAVTFASAPGLCGGPGFGHWTHPPQSGAI